jgi:putative hydrolase of the HAD superfamily
MVHAGIVMDFFGVICSEVAPVWLARHFPPDEAEDIKATLVDSMDRGRLTLDALFQELALRTAVPAQRIASEWRGHVRIDGRLVALMGGWRAAGRKVGLLSNAESSFIRGILNEHRLEPVFDAIVVSSEIGFAKPDAEAYRTILGALRVAAVDALMVDDNPANIRGAAAVGMAGHLFTSFEEFRGAFQ